MAVYLDDILDNLEGEHCIVLLGPQAARTQKGETLSEAVFTHAKAQELDVQRDSDGLLAFGNRRDKTRFPTLMKKYVLENANPTTLHEQLARIKAHLIISLTPDHLLQTAFEEAGIEADFAYYHKGVPRALPLADPDAERPLVYNLFGSMYEPYSLINTQDDLFDFLFAVLGGEKPLPEAVESAIHSARLFLFIGFEFDKWYLKLILRLFGLHEDPIALAASPAMAIPPIVRPFYERQFEMVFVSEDMEGYLGKVYNACEANEKRNLLREAKESAGSPLARRIRDKIKSDQIEEALDLLENYFEQHDVSVLNNVMILSGRYNGLTRKLNKGTLEKGPADIELNQIRDSVLSLANQIEPEST